MTETKSNEPHWRSELNDMRLKEQLCDINLCADSTDGKVFSVHSAVIASCSPYFRQLFSSPHLKIQQPRSKNVYQIRYITTADLENIINYAYTMKINVGPENVETLLPAADMLHVIGVVKECCKYLEANLTPENCIGIYNFAQFYNCINLANKAKKYIFSNFDDVAKSTELLLLSETELKGICEDDELNALDEETIFTAIMRWISYDEEERIHSLPNLIKTIRFGHMNSDYFQEHVQNHKYIRRLSNQNSNCNFVICDAYNILKQIQDCGILSVDYNHPLIRPRIPHNILFVIGGWSFSGTSTTVETYDTKADRWYEVDQPLPEPRAYHGVIAYQSRFYVIGGYDGIKYQNSVLYFEPSVMAWKEAAPMHMPRCYVSVTVLLGNIYACGGYDGKFRQKSAERYNPFTNQWTVIASMKLRRSDADASTINGKIYIAGGFDGQYCLSSIEAYDPEIDQWTVLRNMTKQRSGVGVIAIGSFLYCVGGYDGQCRLDSIERYDPRANEIKIVTRMSVGRSNFALDVLDGRLFVIGGYDGWAISSVVECFDLRKNIWYDASDLNVKRSATSACVISGLDNIKNYTYYGNLPNYSSNGDQWRTNPHGSRGKVFDGSLQTNLYLSP